MPETPHATNYTKLKAEIQSAVLEAVRKEHQNYGAKILMCALILSISINVYEFKKYFIINNDSIPIQIVSHPDKALSTQVEQLIDSIKPLLSVKEYLIMDIAAKYPKIPIDCPFYNHFKKRESSDYFEPRNLNNKFLSCLDYSMEFSPNYLPLNKYKTGYFVSYCEGNSTILVDNSANRIWEQPNDGIEITGLYVKNFEDVREDCQKGCNITGIFRNSEGNSSFVSFELALDNSINKYKMELSNIISNSSVLAGNFQNLNGKPYLKIFDSFYSQKMNKEGQIIGNSEFSLRKLLINHS